MKLSLIKLNMFAKIIDVWQDSKIYHKFNGVFGQFNRIVVKKPRFRVHRKMVVFGSLARPKNTLERGFLA